MKLAGPEIYECLFRKMSDSMNEYLGFSTSDDSSTTGELNALTTTR